MKELLENIAKSLVDNPDEVSVNEVEGEKLLIRHGVRGVLRNGNR